MACYKLLDATEFRPIEDYSPLRFGSADIAAFQAHNFDLTFICDCLRFPARAGSRGHLLRLLACVITPQGERRADSCYGWNRSSAPSCGAGGKSRRVATNDASGRFELGNSILKSDITVS